MYSILDLNEPIVRRIFSHLISVPILDIDSWKRFIPFMAVCQHWRYMVIHRVYRQAFINCFYYDCTGSNNHILKTNVDLIVSCGWHNYVGSLSIILHDNSDFYEAVDFLVERYIDQVVEWPMLCDLFITYDTDSMIDTTVSEHTHAAEDNIGLRRVGERFVRRIKNAKYLSFINHTDIVISTSFISTLIGTYGRNLRYLECSGVSIPKTLVYFSSQLTYLNIGFSGASAFYLPTIFSKSLQTLELSELPSNFLMSSFADCDRIRNIYLNQLHCLLLGYQKQVDTHYPTKSIAKSHYSYTIYAPKLRIFHLKHAPRDFDILHRFKELRLDSFFFVGAVQSIEHLAIESLNVSTHMYIDIADDVYYGGSHLYTITNRHFSRFVSGRKLILSIDCPNYTLMPHLINWQYLDDLTITMPIHIVTLIAMLKGLPNITKLDIVNLTSASTGETLANIVSALDMDHSPICAKTSIIHIRRHATYNSVTHSQMIDTIAYLLRIMPVLKEVYTFREFYDDIRHHIELNTLHYPHLRGVHVYVIMPE